MLWELVTNYSDIILDFKIDCCVLHGMIAFFLNVLSSCG